MGRKSLVPSVAVVGWVAPKGLAAQVEGAADTADVMAVAVRAVDKRGPAVAKEEG